MKKHLYLGLLLLTFLTETVILLRFLLPGTEHPQDTVAVNEALQTVQENWDSLEGHANPTALDYVVLDSLGRVLYRTRPGLSESVNAAIGHRDTVLDIEREGAIVGKLILYNSEALLFQAEKQTAALGLLAVLFLQCGICAGYFFCIQRRILRPFHKLERFAERVAGGNLDIPLEMDRHNLFGAFTESFDLMRSELKKARIAEARANSDKKELVAKLSHDIKTPVASIKAASEVGAALAGDEKIRKNYEQIIRKADQINTLITNLFSAALEELHELSVTNTDFKSEELRPLLENADYLHRASIPDIPPCLLYGDRLRLQQVFDNIFANSYKYANTEIELAIRAGEGYLSVCMEDYGKGVDDAELPLLLEKFKRGSNAGEVEGAGLGLYISDYCMKQMRGRLTVEKGTHGLKVTVRIALSRAI